MEGYRASTYGDGFADVYDEWYGGISDIAATVAALADLADAGPASAGRDRAPVLELGVGTGRLALPLADALAGSGIGVHGLDASEAMLARLRAKDPSGRVTAHLGDMAGNLPDGPFGLVFVAYNSLFNLISADAQRACFAAVAERLVPGGRFVVEAFVPDDPPRAGNAVEVRSVTTERVVLAVSVHHPDAQRAEGQYVELSARGGVRMRPWAIRYAPPAELDAMAGAAGLRLEHRWRAFDEHRFDPHDDRHVSVYRR